jgi:hypothetical protein
MIIQPTYVTFEQAKWLKEKGFNIELKSYYRITGSGVFESPKPVNHNDDKSQETAGGMTYVSAPEQWQVVEWLRVNHNIDLQAICNYSEKGRSYRMGIIYIKENKVESVFLRKDYGFTDFIEFNSPQEAYSAAFDYIKENIIK